MQTVGYNFRNHQHPLQLENRDYCCNVCSKGYSNKSPSYYCSTCDYDVCPSCYNSVERAGQNLGPIQMPGSNLGTSSKPLFPKENLNVYHEHGLEPKNRSNWACANCKKSFENETAYCCLKCNFNLCKDCRTRYLN